ncbi:MAG: DUF5114 domain-containing protein [Marinilabiliaceae bacterium]|nr:DUF5114 domain-containing protein [Marinilabiliaceae bacterium]
MKTKIFFIAAIFLALFSACEKDGEILTVSGLNSSDLFTSETDVVLSKLNANTNVLAFNWDVDSLYINDKSLSLPSSIPNIILEVSDSIDFSSKIVYVNESGIIQFTGAELNTMAKNLGFEAYVSTPMFFRVKSAYGSNTDPFYSNVIIINVTSYYIDMSIGFILDKDKNDSGFKLYSQNSDGNYAGFVGATAWNNWFIKEGDDAVWGNVGVDGNEFNISNDVSSMWNFWYPGIGGCYYSTVSTGDKEWSATLIPSLTISYDTVLIDMTFDRAQVKWFASLKTTTDNISVKVSCDSAKLYNVSTGTDDALAINKTLGFIPAADSTLSIDWNSTSAGNITFDKAGDYTLTFYLADPTHWTFEIKSGATVVADPISKYLYLPGIDDGISGSWTFDNYIDLISEDDSTFGGAINVNSLWGYTMSLIKDEWNEVYKMGNAEGALEFKGASNIIAPDSGFYLIEADLKNLTYSHTLIDTIFIQGLNDVWDFESVVLLSTETGVYKGVATINSPSPWGIKIHIGKSWDRFFGGTFNSLVYKGTNITDDQSLAVGTYNVTVDFINKTCSFVAQ